MLMPLKLQQKLKQKLTISHKMQQSLSVLSLSNEELNQEIQKELLENPVLEAVNKDPETVESSMPFSNDYSLYDSVKISKRNKNSDTEFSFESFKGVSESLKSFVLNQANLSCFPKDIKCLLPFLISFLDERGYLSLNLEETALKENIPLDVLKKALEALQSLEPSGIGGRDLRECLLIQLKHKKGDTRIPRLIIKNHLHNMKEKKYGIIAQDLNISLKKFRDYLKIILSLEPNPGRNFSNQPTVFARPDFYIYKEGNQYKIFLNNENLPNLRLSSAYTHFLKKAGNLNPLEKKYLIEKTNSAQWFIQSIHQRQKKIKQLALCLIDKQKTFFDKGPTALKPLKMEDIAKEMSVHISTISRTVNNKYAYTPQGLISLKVFFQKGIRTKDGDRISVPEIKRAIKKWIQEEDPQNPLSDEQLREKVYRTFQISLLRRSLNLYRSSLGFPSYRTRKWRNSQNLLFSV